MCVIANERLIPPTTKILPRSSQLKSGDGKASKKNALPKTPTEELSRFVRWEKKIRQMSRGEENITHAGFLKLAH